MPLRLRRGTDTERQLITPQEGELIYVTDTKELWAGDGTTQGGVKVTGNIPENLNDLDDIDLSVAPQIGQVLKWNGAAFVAANDINTGTIGIVEGSNYRINIVSNDSTVLVDTETSTFNGNLTGYVTGDLQGSVFSDFSTTLIDGQTGYIEGDVVNERVITKNLAVNTDAPTPIGVVTSTPGGSGGPNLLYDVSRGTVESPTTLFAGDTIIDIIATGLAGIIPETVASVIKMGVDKNVTVSDGILPGRILFLTYNSSGGTGINNALVFNSEGNLGIKTDLPAEALDVRGSGVFSGDVQAAAFKGSLVSDDSTIIVDAIEGTVTASGFVQFGSYSKLDRDALTAANGMVLYNTTSNRFQGYQNDAWINLDDGTADP